MRKENWLEFKKIWSFFSSKYFSFFWKVFKENFVSSYETSRFSAGKIPRISLWVLRNVKESKILLISFDWQQISNICFYFSICWSFSYILIFLQMKEVMQKLRLLKYYSTFKASLLVYINQKFPLKFKHFNTRQHFLIFRLFSFNFQKKIYYNLLEMEIFW